MQSRRLVGQPVDDRSQLLVFEATDGGERLHPAPVRVLADEVELGAVAGREADCLAAVCETACELRRLRERDERALADRDRRRLVGESDESEVHEKWVSWRPMRATITSAKPASAR